MLSSTSTLASPIRCPPPSRFLPADSVRSARLLESQPPFIRRRRARGAKARGVSYERKVHGYLERFCATQVGMLYRREQWVEFVDLSGKRWCQIDGLMVDTIKKHVTIVEVKYKHCSDAWWQLWRLYLPVVRAIYKEYSHACLEVVRWFDPATAFPSEIQSVRLPSDLLLGHVIGVHVWNPQRA